MTRRLDSGHETPALNEPARRLAGPAVILLAAAVAIAPQLVRGNSCGHDFDFHLVSWLDCLNSWRHGILYPHWAPQRQLWRPESRALSSIRR